MAKGVNMCVLLGNVGRDPEIRATSGGTTVASFSLATADRKKNGDKWEDTTEWHNIVALGRTAEVVRDYVSKGSQLHIVGKMQTRSWDDRETGTKKYKTEVLVNELTLLGGKKDGEDRGKSGGGYDRAGDRTGVNDYASNNAITDDDIPF